MTLSIRESRLAPAPASAVTGEGHPATGSFEGALPTVDWNPLRPPFRKSRIWKALHTKKWHFAGIATSECFIGLAVVDIGWAANGFAYLLDRKSDRLLFDRSVIAPPGLGTTVSLSPRNHSRSRFRSLRLGIRIDRAGDRSPWQIHVRGMGGFQVEATFDAESAGPTLGAIAPIEGGVANCTHKTLCLPVSGFAKVGETRYNLEGGTASLDHTCGLLARETEWKWASVSAPGIGVNLVEGFNGSRENGIWLDGKVSLAGAASIEVEDDTREWRARTEDGRVQLHFQPRAWRRENLNLGFARSRFVQAVGNWSGSIGNRTIDSLPGVAEKHYSIW